MEKSFSIGRDSSNHLVIDSASVSGHHAKLLQRDDIFILKDLGSKNGTLVNGQRITQKNIACGNKIRFGDVELEVIDPFANQMNSYWSLIADANWLSGQEFPLKFTPREQTLTLGRSSECDIIIPGTHLSRRHAEFSLLDDNTIALKDLQSANGTFVNEHAISFKEIKAGDRLRFDVYSFRLFGPGINLPKAATHQRSTTVDIASLGNDSLFPAEENTGYAPLEKRWKTKPTSVGNREELNLYKKNWAPTVLALVLVASFTAFMTYLIMSSI